MALTVAGHAVSWLWLLVDALAVYRIVRLVQTDSISDRLRLRVLRAHPTHPSTPRAGELPDPPPMSTLLVCAWCLSPWVALAALAATVWLPWLWVWAAVPLALSAAAGYLSERA